MCLKRLFIAATAAAAVAGSSSAADFGSMAISDLKVATYGSDALGVEFNLAPGLYRLASENSLTLTPVLRANSGADSLELAPVVLAGRVRNIRLQRSPKSLPEGATLLRAGQTADCHYQQTLQWQSWMNDATLSIRTSESGCCGKPRRSASVPVAVLEPCPQLPPVKEVPAHEAYTERHDTIFELHGKAFVDFPVNSTVIDSLYHDNPRELHKIIASIDSVRLNPMATIKGVIIKGYASPEGSYENNTRLASGRAAALVDYVKSLYDMPASLFHSEYEPEDWEGLLSALDQLALPHKDEIREIIATVSDTDERNNAIRTRYPREYRYLLRNVYPRLRHSDYTVQYTLRDIEEIYYEATPAIGQTSVQAPLPENCHTVRYLPDTGSSVFLK